jgi:hypothetical protein
MRKRFPFISPRIGLLVLALLVTGLALYTSPPVVAAPNCCGHASTVTYYNNAQHTTIVGHCFFPCDTDPTCTGTQTQYFTTKQGVCCIC